MDLKSDDAVAQGFINRMHVYANEALTQICSAIKPKHTRAEFNVMTRLAAWNYCVTEYGVYSLRNKIDTLPIRPSNLTETQKVFWDAYDGINKVGTPIKMPDDFIVFNDNIIQVIDGCNIVEAHDDRLQYIDDNHIMFIKPGIYYVPYNARWYLFTSTTSNDEELDIPLDICDALPSYIASQLFKIDDEVKSQIFRNEYEMFLSRIDDTNFRENRTFIVGGNW